MVDSENDMTAGHKAETTGLSVLEKIEQSQSMQVLALEVPEWGGVTLELREPPHQEIKKLILFYNKESKSGVKTKDKLDYALAALCLYSAGGEPLFEGVSHAEEFLQKKGTRTVQKVLKAIRMLCIIEEDEALEEAENV